MLLNEEKILSLTDEQLGAYNLEDINEYEYFNANQKTMYRKHSEITSGIVVWVRRQKIM